MTSEPTAHIEPSRHSTAEVDEFLQHVEGHVNGAPGAGSPAIKPNPALGDDGKPTTDAPGQPAA